MQVTNIQKLFTSLFNKTYFKLKWKKKALQKKANHSWTQIKSNNKYTKEFSLFFEKIKAKNFLPILDIKSDKTLNNTTPTIQNYINILNKKIYFNNNIDWHQNFNHLAFFQNITPKNEKFNDFNNYLPDIKIPWELSRMHHIYSLGIKYNKTKNIIYTKTFINHITDWLNKNPFLLGVNWVCPMDVAIRAINLIYGLYFFKGSRSISVQFWEKYICCLYDHAIYLENNWEIFYKTNNHYLADLIGYFYLCFLFNDFSYFKKKKKIIYKRILKQFDLQIQDDGSSYEGSTNYHKLVIEIFYNFYLLCEKNKIKLPNAFIQKLIKSIQFINDCNDYNKNLVQIGDNDNGNILPNNIKYSKLNISKKNLSDINHYSDFGLTIIKTKEWHITYRHPTYKKNQPTGHFHQDELSITLSFNNIPILIDPGTYVYTANSSWRNLMRSKKMHNTFYTKEDNLNKTDLFLLNKKEQKDTSVIKNKHNSIYIQNFKNENGKSRLFRRLIFNKLKKQLIIKDWAESSNSQIKWNFIFNPQIELIPNFLDNKLVWQIFYQKKHILNFKSNLKFKESTGFYSSSYGKIEKCYKLYAKTSEEKKIKIILYATKTQ